MGNIDMTPDKLPMGRNAESTIQVGGGAGIDMVSSLPLSHTPVSSVQVGGAASGLDMIGNQGLLNRTPANPYGQKFPADKGE